MIHIDMHFFRSKVARRTFLLFVACAIVPIAVLTLLTFSHVKLQLNDQSREHLKKESKNISMSLYGQLLLHRAELQMVAASLETDSLQASFHLSDGRMKSLTSRFSGVALVSETGAVRSILGEQMGTIHFTDAQIYHVKSGGTLLLIQSGSPERPSLKMLTGLGRNHRQFPALLGKINEGTFWSAADGRPSLTEICVFDKNSMLLFSSKDGISIPDQALHLMTRRHTGWLEWDGEDDIFTSGFSSLFMKPAFASPEWYIILSKSRSDILAPTSTFMKIYPMIIILSIGIILLVSSNQIRKNMIPVSILKDATKKIADGDFGSAVDIRTGDEFESLAESFNDMSKKIRDGQALLVQAAKLSTIGQMSAGIVHEIKQPLTAIYGHLQLALMNEETDEQRNRLQTILTAVERLNVILLKFKSFSHMADDELQHIDLKKVIDDVHALLGHHFTMKNIDSVFECEPNLLPVRGDNQKLQQVLTNLLINAIDALEETPADQRSIIVRACSQSDSVVLEISDNGCGIPEKIRDRIFDPFFTTKSAEKGTGLGMAIVQSILKKHNATIDVKSDVGRGTTFRIFFPRIE